MSNMVISSRSQTFDNPIDDLSLLKKTVKTLLERLLEDSEVRIRRIGVKVSNLLDEKEAQKQLDQFMGKTAQKNTGNT